MKKSLIYFSALLFGMGASTVLSSCDNDFEYPPMVVPHATIHANTTIADFKADFFQSGSNSYATQIGYKTDTVPYIIEGVVTSSDQAGNYFKQVVIQDSTSAIQINIDSYDLYQSYQIGQKVVVNVTNLYAGAYGRLMQVGAAPTNNYPARIATDVFSAHAQVDGLPSAAKAIQPEVISLSTLSNVKPDSEQGLILQNRYVKIENVTFANGGKETISKFQSNGESQTFGNAEGSAVLYTSGYADFWDYYCPTGTGDVVGILSCYNQTWQIKINSIAGLQGFDPLKKEETQNPDDPNNPDDPGITEEDGDGTLENPFTCSQVISGTGEGTSAWITGYIVGSANGASASTFEPGVANPSASNIFIAANPAETDYKKCVPIQLLVGDIRNAISLANHPELLGVKISLYGSLEKYFGQPGLKSTSNYTLNGDVPETPDVPDTPDTPDTPATPGEDGVYNVAAALSLINSGNIPAGKVQVRGVISSITEVETSQFGNATYIIKDTLSDAKGLTIYRGYYLNGDKFTSKDQIKVGGTVVVEGELVLYGGNTPEMTTGNQIISYTAPN